MSRRFNGDSDFKMYKPGEDEPAVSEAKPEELYWQDWDEWDKENNKNGRRRSRASVEREISRREKEYYLEELEACRREEEYRRREELFGREREYRRGEELSGREGEYRREEENSGREREYRRGEEYSGRKREYCRGEELSGREREYRQAKEKPRTGKKKKKRHFRWKRFLLILAAVLALLAGGLYCIVGAVYDKMHYVRIDSCAEAPLQEEGVINILLIGNDSRENGEDGRSDAMILLSVSRKTKQIYMTSLLRDMYVEIPGYKGNRLNAAYSYGGAELLMETIELNLGISVNRYVQVNFEAFANLVDAVGGVDLELTEKEVEYVNGYLVEYNILTGRPEGTDYMDTSISGMVHLNGPQALAYSRNRYLGTDFGRTERQRKVLQAVIDKLPKAVLTNPGQLINGLMPNLTTNLTKGECYRLCLKAFSFLGYDMVQASIPIEGSYTNATIREMAVLEVDFEENKQFLQQNIYGKN